MSDYSEMEAYRDQRQTVRTNDAWSNTERLKEFVRGYDLGVMDFDESIMDRDLDGKTMAFRRGYLCGFAHDAEIELDLRDL